MNQLFTRLSSSDVQPPDLRQPELQPDLPGKTHVTHVTDSSILNPLSFPTIDILLVDDQEVVGKVMQRIFASEPDIAFYHCCDPKEALQLAIQQPPTVILLDLVMPEIDGLLLLRWLRLHSATCDVPIVMLSATEEPELKAKAFAQGANDYLIKPPEVTELIARIRYHARSYQNFKGLIAATHLAQTQSRQLEQTLQALQLTQAQLIQTEKLAGLEQVVSGMAHEINNPINFIYGNLAYAQEYAEQLLQLAHIVQQKCPASCLQSFSRSADIDVEFIAEDLPRLLASMKVGVDRVRQIILSMRSFSHLDQAEQKAVDIHEGIESTLLILQRHLAKRSPSSGIEVIKEYGDLSLVECYPAELNQVFMSLLNNAIDAIEERKRQTDESYVGQIHISTQISDRSTVVVHVKDNGCGIPEAVQQRIFDPFFTTKPVGKGTGLGLSSSYQIIVNQHGGSLRCVSVPGQGSDFWVEIPCQIQNGCGEMS